MEVKYVFRCWMSDFRISCIDDNIRKAVNLLDSIKKWPKSTYLQDRRIIIEELMDYLLDDYAPDLNAFNTFNDK